MKVRKPSITSCLLALACTMATGHATAQDTEKTKKLAADFALDSLGCMGLRDSHIMVVPSDTAGMDEILIDGEDRTGETEAWVRRTLGKPNAEWIPGHLWYTFRCAGRNSGENWILGAHLADGRVKELSVNIK